MLLAPSKCLRREKSRVRRFPRRWRPNSGSVRRRSRDRRADRELQAHFARLGHAFDLAGQPVGLQSNRNGRGVRRCRHLHRGSKQHAAVIAVIDQCLYRNLDGNRPLHFCGHPSLGQLPLHAGCRSGLARIFPVRVPSRRMLQMQPQPQRLARSNPLGRPGQQTCRYLFRTRFLGWAGNDLECLGRSRGKSTRLRPGHSRPTLPQQPHGNRPCAPNPPPSVSQEDSFQTIYPIGVLSGTSL